MSRFTLSSSLALFQSVSGSDSEATSSSTSSTSAINNSSGSLSLSPLSGAIQSNQTKPPSSRANNNIASSLFDQQTFKFGCVNKLQPHQPNISNHLLELQKEIKEEEEEIFALINNRSNLYSSFDDDTDDLEDNLGGLSNTTAVTTVTDTSCPPFNTANNIKKNLDLSYNVDYFQEDEDQGLGHDSDQINDENVSQNHYHLNNPGQCDENINIHNNNNNNSHNRYHEDQDYPVLCNRLTGQQQNSEAPNEDVQEEQQYLEIEHDEDHQHLHLDEQLHQEDDLEQQRQQQLQHLDDYQRDLQQLTSNLPKPCVFFLEGNCRRSDCKYSHDLSSITCKYWIEGFCFKGESCPFMHSFNQKCQTPSLLDDDIALSKAKLNPTFAIESEADFPSLPLDAPNITLSAGSNLDKDSDLTKTIEDQILSSNPAVVFKTTKKKRKKG